MHSFRHTKQTSKNVADTQPLKNMLDVMKTKLTKAVNKNLKFCQIKVLFKTTNKHKNCFHFTDLVPETLCSNQVLQIFCVEAAQLLI